MKPFFFLLCALVLALSSFPAVAAEDHTVIIYSSAEDYRNEYFQGRLNEQFPDYNIVIEYLPTGTHAARLMAEGAQTDCDISFELEYGYIEKLTDIFADLSAYDTSMFVEDMLPSTRTFLPDYRNGGCIAIAPAVLEKNGLAKPQTYADLLKPEYKGLISMPSPKSSGTGYMFLLALVNEWGEEEAFAYFDQLAENVLQFTSSGAGPVNALIQGEVAIGLAMTGQTVTKINDGENLEILYFEEGSPWCAYGYGMIAGKEEKPAVRAVFDFFYSTLVREDKALFFPEQIYQNETFEVANYPKDIRYADMRNNTPEEKERLLERWEY